MTLHYRALGTPGFGIDDARLVVGNLELELTERQVFAAGNAHT